MLPADLTRLRSANNDAANERLEVLLRETPFHVPTAPPSPTIPAAMPVSVPAAGSSVRAGEPPYCGTFKASSLAPPVTSPSPGTRTHLRAPMPARPGTALHSLQQIAAKTSQPAAGPAAQNWFERTRTALFTSAGPAAPASPQRPMQPGRPLRYPGLQAARLTPSREPVMFDGRSKQWLSQSQLRGLQYNPAQLERAAMQPEPTALGVYSQLRAATGQALRLSGRGGDVRGVAGKLDAALSAMPGSEAAKIRHAMARSEAASSQGSP